MSDYKDTLNILTTDFEMKANLPTKEPIIQKMWLDDKIYSKLLAKNKLKKQKTLHDGPPYANGSIHCGHALNKILKDMIVRYWNMAGFYSNYIPGWDTHGMPIEHALIKKGINTDANLSIAQKRENCKKFALEQIEIQKQQFMRLGLLSDHQNIYQTLDKEFEADQLDVFAKAIKQKLVYQDFKPVYWSTSSQTALAEAEIEYADASAWSIYVSFNVCVGKGRVKNGDKLLIWTTTPWTIPSNLAIAINSKIKYLRVKVDNDVFVVAKDLLPSLSPKLGWKNMQTLDEVSGGELDGAMYEHPLYFTKSPVILAEYVSTTDGTGLVHNAPDFGAEDYLACKKYNIKPFHPLDHFGKFNNNCIDKELIGMFYETTNELIITKLTNANAIYQPSKITHSVAHDWRTKKPVIYRSTRQWFIDISKIKKTILSVINKVDFPNELSKKQLIDMITNRSEWCISRQRYWGVPIPIIYNDKDEPIFDLDLINNIISIIRQEGSNVWFDKPVSYFLTAKYNGTKGLRKETDILDVWFDSGTTFSILAHNNLSFPAFMYLEGKDQFRGWFNSSLINGVIVSKKAPYKTLVGHGYVLDGQGQKMSKSLGNVIDPMQVINKYGADVLRLWVATSDYTQDVKISDQILEQVAEIYRRIRNSLFKFILANISDFEYEKNKNTKFLPEDLYVLSQLSQNITTIHKYYNSYSFLNIVELINKHIIDLSAWYFNIIKDSLYCDEKNDVRRRTIQTVLYAIFNSYLSLLAPIIPHTCDEAYNSFNKKNKQPSIIFEPIVKKIPFTLPKTIDMKKWEQFFLIKDTVYNQIEKLRNVKHINKSNEASVVLKFNNKFNFKEKDLAMYLNVALVKIENNSHSTEIVANVIKGDGLIRCERCWNYFNALDINNSLCPRCHKIINKKK